MNFPQLTIKSIQIIAFCEAAHEVKPEGLSDTELRQRIAQWGFREIIELFPYRKLNYLFEAGESPTTVDSLEIEKGELKTAVTRGLWDGKGRRKYRSIYKSFRRLMRACEFEPEVKSGFKLIFEIAIGEVSSSKKSAIDILEKVEEVWQGISEDSTLQDAWDYEVEEAEAEEYDEEDEDYEEDEK